MLWMYSHFGLPHRHIRAAPVTDAALRTIRARENAPLSWRFHSHPHIPPKSGKNSAAEPGICNFAKIGYNLVGFFSVAQ